MHVSTDSATDNELLDRVIDKGIVVEAWDRLGLPAIDLSGMRVSVSVLELFEEGRNPPFRAGHFIKKSDALE